MYIELKEQNNNKV